MSNRTQYDLIVGKDKHGDIIVLDYIFDHGAVGSIFRPVDKVEYRERRSRKAVVESLAMAGADVCESEREAIKLYQNMKAMGELDCFCFDESYRHMHAPIREAFKLSEEKYPIIECTGGGRVFSREMDMEQIICEPEIMVAIKDAEGLHNG